MYEWEIVGLKELGELGSLKRSVKSAAVRSINRTAERTRTASAREIRQQVAFPSSYLSPSGGRLAVSTRASSNHLEARILARARPTSLARFAIRVGAKKGVTVEVKPGNPIEMPGAFIVMFGGNRALAIRLRPGQQLNNRKFAKRSASGLFILYGPSVYQVARTVFVDVAEDAASFLEKEFERQIRREAA